MTFHQSDLGNIPFYICFDFAVIRLDLHPKMFGRRLILDHANDMRLDLRAVSCSRPKGKVLRCERFLQMNGLGRPRGIFHRRQFDQQLTLLSNDLSLGNDHVRFEIHQVFNQHNIRPATRGDHAHLSGETKMLSRVDGHHLNGRHRIQTFADGVAQYTIHVAFGSQRLRVGIICAKDEAARIHFLFSDRFHLCGYIEP